MEFSEGQRQALESILTTLQQQVEGIEEVACLHKDGTILTHISSSDHPDQTAALLVEYSQLLERLTQILEHSEALETFYQGEKWMLALYRVQAQWMLGVIGQTTNLGLLQRACRQTARKIQALFAAVVDLSA